MSIGSISRRRTSRKKSLEIKKMRKNNMEFNERVKRQNKMVYDKLEAAKKEEEEAKKARTLVYVR